MKINFWTRLKKFAEKKESEAYMAKYHFDFKCPHCHVWQSNCGGPVGVKNNFPDAMHDTYACGQCGRWIVMHYFGMIGEVSRDQTAAKDLEPLSPKDPNNKPQLFRT